MADDVRPATPVPPSLVALAPLTAIADASGGLAILAMDQRGTLRSMLRDAGRPDGDDELRSFKVDVVRALSPLATGVLLDAEYGVEAVRAAGALAPGTGLLVAAEVSPAPSYQGEPRAAYDPARGPAWVRGLGGSALKFLVRWRPDRPVTGGGPDLAAEAVDAVRAVVADCRAAGLPSVVEPLVQRLPGESLDAAAKEALVVESARRLARLRPDLLKLEWPGAAGCSQITAALAGVPWALLSAGVAFDEFAERVAVAVAAGARGFIAGRAIWGEAVRLDGAERVAFLDEVARPRLARLIDVLASSRGGTIPGAGAAVGDAAGNGAGEEVPA
jgi:tagatose 1,6-diphosphate aldolase/sulfofructosephosphate aldolase